MQPILNINLTTNETEVYAIPEKWGRDYLGGASLAARLLYDNLSESLDPLAPEAPLLFLTGPLTGTAGPSVGRFVICGKSPATQLWAESNCGGFWGPELRKAGYLGLWVTGKAEGPVYIWIEDQEVEIRDADHLWGLETDKAQAAVAEELKGRGRPKIAVIGPAGETQIPYALVLTDHGRVAGRTGMGAVMGAKNLKAVAVRGHGKIPTSSADYPVLRSEANRLLRDDTFTNTARELGTAAVADYADYMGEMPKKYFQSGTFDGVYNVSGATMAETILTGVSACHACAIACGRVVKLPDEDNKRKGPEYETIVGFGPNLLVDDLNFITRIGERCDQLGLDTISLSNTMGLAFQLFENEVISSKDTGDLILEWGDTAVIERLVEMTAQKEGFGAYLAEGARSLGRRFGREEEAVQVNGLEVAYHDPRGASGMALTYATSPRGACHNQSDYFMADLFGQTEDEIGLTYFERHAGAEKAANVAVHQNWRTVFNSLVMCVFANVPAETVLDLVNAATGNGYTLDELMQCGERGWTLKRLINRRLGLTGDNDRLPKALLEPYKDGGAAGFEIPFGEMLTAYYAARGWDPETGIPSAETRAGLGLDIEI